MVVVEAMGILVVGRGPVLHGLEWDALLLRLLEIMKSGRFTFVGLNV